MAADARPATQATSGASGAVTAADVLAALADVTDPEWPVSVVDMGLVYEVRVEGRAVDLTLTFTATGCPCMDMIQDDIRERLRRLAGVHDVRITVSWDPPWSPARLSDRAREELARCGVAV